MPACGLLRLAPQVVAARILLRLPFGHGEGVEAHRRQKALRLKDQGASPLPAVLLLRHAGDAPVVPQGPLKFLRVPLRLLQQHEGQEGPPLRLRQSGLVLLAQGKVGGEPDHLLLLPPLVEQAEPAVHLDGEPLQGQSPSPQPCPG